MNCSGELKEIVYDVLILWQIVLDRRFVDEKYKYKSGIIIPMYDDFVFKQHANWFQYIDFKVLCFSKALYESIKEWGFEAKYVQYFVEPKNDYFKGNSNSAFFWQRVESFDIESAECLIMDSCITHLHVHKALDPNHKYKELCESRIKRSYSTWFEKESDMIDCMLESAVYIAPRAYEGIGMSFLTAMSYGRCVIAPNNSTMNEYIENGVTGLLWDKNEPLHISENTIKKIQANTINYVNNGYKKWIDSIDELLDWMESMNCTIPLSLDDGRMKYFKNELEFDYLRANKYEKYFNCIYDMVRLSNDAQRIKCYFDENNVSRVAIYGVGKLCDIFINLFENSNLIKIDYLIDKKRKSYGQYNVYSPTDNFPDTDLIIVSPINESFFIIDKLKAQFNTRIIGLDELINRIKYNDSLL